VARVPDDELERLKAEVSLVRLVEGQGVSLRKHGADLIGCCPFHDDRDPSFVVSVSKNLWCCHGACQVGGSVIDFVMRAEGVSFRHAVDLLRQGVGVTDGVPVVKSTVTKMAPLARPDVEDRELLDRVVGFYADTLRETPDALGFLARRRIDHPDAVTVFRLGFADRSLGYRLPAKNRRDGADLRGRLQALGLLRPTGHEHFRGSLVIPVLDAGGVVTEVYGRKIRDDLRAGTPKHLYLPGPHRGVWNPAAFTAGDEVIVTESLIDALSLWCWGFRHVTAAFGTEGFGPDLHKAIEGHGIRRVVLAFDNDPAGNTAATKIAGRLLETGVEVFRLNLPAGADVNDVVVAADDPTDTLGRLLRTASWMGAGTPPARRREAPVLDARPVAITPGLDADGEAVDVEVVEPPQPPVPPTDPVAPDLVSPAAVTDDGPAVLIDERELTIVFGERRWRVRGLAKVTSFDLLRVNVLAAVGDRFHVDTLDLYSARARSAFCQMAATELGVDEGVIKRDLGRVLLACETHAEDVITGAQAPKTVEVTLTDPERETALGLLRDPDLVERVVADFERVGLVGEATNCLVGYLAAVSRLLDQPLAVIVQSTSAAGKSALMDAVLGFVPDEHRVRFSAMTGQSLFYMGESDLAHKVLAISEEEGAERAAYALKLLQSEGELSIASTGKDTASGRLVTHTYSVTGPTAIMLTTTAIDIDEELLNRCVVLTVNEDRAQTQAIHVRQRHRHTLSGLLAANDRDQVIARHRNAQRLLAALPVVIPGAERLTFADTSTRTRRDHVKYLGLIRASALLHQHQRPRRTATTADGRTITYIEAAPADVELANRLAHDVLGQSLDELPPQTRRLLILLDAHVAAEATAREVDRTAVRFTRRQLRELFGWGDTQLKVHLARLVDMELVWAHRGAGLQLVYELAWSGEGRDGGRFLNGLTPLAAAETTAMTADRSGPSGDRSGPGRSPVGPQSGADRTDAGSPQPAPAQANSPADADDGPNGTEPGPTTGGVVVVSAGA
jgi:DNA primase